jgi:hypothetical protein
MNITEATIKEYGLNHSDYGLLFPDYELMLLRTPFKDLGDRSSNQIIIANWWMNVYDPNNSVDQYVWQTWNNAQRNNFSYCRTSGYTLKTGQSCPRISLNRDHETWPQIEELQKYTEYSKYSAKEFSYSDQKYQYQIEKRPSIYIDVFENTLSEYGVYYLRMFHEKDVRLYICSYSHVKLLKNFESLFDAIDYTKEHHYYD